VLFKDHLDNAVTDALLEQAEAGRGLGHGAAPAAREAIGLNPPGPSGRFGGWPHAYARACAPRTPPGWPASTTTERGAAAAHRPGARRPRPHGVPSTLRRRALGSQAEGATAARVNGRRRSRGWAPPFRRKPHGSSGGGG
jgi:hypothetical protein